MSNAPKTFAGLRDFYLDHLLNHVMPFWDRHTIDWEHGGIFTGIDDDGSIVTRNKYLWSNARAIYTYAALYNRIEKRAIWLETARNIKDFCLEHGQVKPGVWGFLCSEDGKMIEGEKSLVVDLFAIMGLSEYYRATGDQKCLEAAMQTFDTVRDRLSRPGSYGTHPYLLPEGMKAHRYYMQSALAFFLLGTASGNETVVAESVRMAEEIMQNFRRPERKALVEYVTLENEFSDTPAGRTMVPGHAIESMWFVMQIYRHTGNKTRLREAAETIRWATEQGWDQEYGGLYLAIDIDGKEPLFWNNADTKIWWVFSEALYALLLAFEETSEEWAMDWFRRLHDWSFSHFPNHEHGDWTQKLDRKGNKIDTVVALPVKDPFHLPRALIYCVEVLSRLAERG